MSGDAAMCFAFSLYAALMCVCGVREVERKALYAATASLISAVFLYSGLRAA